MTERGFFVQIDSLMASMIASSMIPRALTHWKELKINFAASANTLCLISLLVAFCNYKKNLTHIRQINKRDTHQSQ